MEVSSRGVGFLFLDLLQATKQHIIKKSVLTFRSGVSLLPPSGAREQLTSDALDDASCTTVTQEPKRVQQFDFPQLYFSLKGNH